MFKRLKAWFSKHKKPVLITLATLLVVLGGFGLYNSLKSDDSVARTDTDSANEEVVVPVFYSPLTGLETSEKLASRPVTAVVIENSPSARPQSSIVEAGVGFEAIAEGGITRYVLFYQETKPDPIGPVRSMRPYFNDWVLAFDASVAHVGGSAIAQQQIRDLGVKDLDQFWNPQAYYRVNYRFAPHNVYTDFKALDKLNNQKGFKKSTFEPWERKNDRPLNSPKARKITINPSSYLYQSNYTYNKDCNCYRRSVAGAAMKDAETGKQVSPKVVVAMNAPVSINFATGRYVYDFVGSGKVTIFQDGKVIKGKWRKPSRDAMIMFETNSGSAIKLNRGQVWITAIAPNQKANYTK